MKYKLRPPAKRGEQVWALDCLGTNGFEIVEMVVDKCNYYFRDGYWALELEGPFTTVQKVWGKTCFASEQSAIHAADKLGDPIVETPEPKFDAGDLAWLKSADDCLGWVFRRVRITRSMWSDEGVWRYSGRVYPLSGPGGFTNRAEGDLVALNEVP